MPSLTIKSLPVRGEVKPAVVEVPEFNTYLGMDSDSETFTVNVLPLTVLTNNILTTYTRQIALLENGEVTTRRRKDMDESVVIAAIHSVDDSGDLVFGTDYDTAVNHVSGLPPQLRSAILRIAQAAISLGRGDREPEPPGTTADQVLESEKKD